MKRIHILLYIFAGSLLSACRKDAIKIPLPESSISINGLATKDTLIKEVGMARDTVYVIGLHAKLDGEVSTNDHIVDFRPDTTRLADYQAKYGNALLLPSNSYFFFRSQCRIPAGASLSDSIQLNIVAQTSLKPETVYVLPVTIRYVDGSADAIASGQVLFIVIKTGKRPGISKEKWRIVSASSVRSAANAAENVLDNNLNTIWASAFAPMPQNLVIDFADQVTFNGVSYGVPAANFAAYGGGYPIKLKIEVSVNGTTWIDKGTYNGVTTPVVWSQDIGRTTARYMRFTVLQAAPYVAGISVVMIGDISLVP